MDELARKLAELIENHGGQYGIELHQDPDSIRETLLVTFGKDTRTISVKK